MEQSATDYDNMYSTDYGTYDSHCALLSNGSKKEKIIPDFSTKFVAKLEQMQSSDCNVRELYSELESDVAECESLVGDTDYETESGLHPTGKADYNHPLHKLERAENKLLALLKPLQATGTQSTVGSTLRHCRSLEMLPNEDSIHLSNDKLSGHKPSGSVRNSQNFDNISMLSSMLGSEFSRSDPYLSDSAAYESEYDNYEHVRLLSGVSKQQRQPPRTIDSIDSNQFVNIDFDKIKINETMTTDDYIQSLQQHIDGHQQPPQANCTDV